MTRLWYVSFIKISSHKETESSQTNKVFIRGKKIKYAWVDRWGRLRKNLLPCGCLNPLYEAFLPGFFLASHLICLVLSLYLAYLRLLPHVCSALSQRWILAKRPIGSWHHLKWGSGPSLFDLQRAFLHMCSHRSLLDFKKAEYGIFNSYLGSCSSVIMILWSFCPQGRNYSAGAHLSPSWSDPQDLQQKTLLL